MELRQLKSLSLLTLCLSALACATADVQPLHPDGAPSAAAIRTVGDHEYEIDFTPAPGGEGQTIFEFMASLVQETEVQLTWTDAVETKLRAQTLNMHGSHVIQESGLAAFLDGLLSTSELTCRDLGHDGACLLMIEGAPGQ